MAETGEQRLEMISVALNGLDSQACLHKSINVCIKRASPHAITGMAASAANSNISISSSLNHEHRSCQCP